jgi:LAT3 family solute carrier family 43 protein 3
MSGTFYGFWQLAYMLQLEGGYREACPAGALLADGCPSLDAAWGALFTNTSVLAFSVPLLSGVALPYVGPRATVILLTAVFAAGVALLLAAAQGAAPGALRSAFILPGLACIATAAAANYLPLLSVASLFKRRTSLVLSVLSGSFDTGSGVFLVMRLLYDAGARPPALLAGFLGGPVACMFLIAAALWRDAPFHPPPEAPESPHVVLAALAAAGSVHGKPPAPASGGEGDSAAAAGEAGGHRVAAPPAPAPAAFPKLAHLHGLPLLKQMATVEYAVFFLFFAVLALRFNWFLSSFASQLGALGAPSDVDAQVAVLGYLMPTLALPAVLVAGFVLDARGPLAGLTLLSCLGTLLSALQLVPSLPLQGFTALVFVMFRGTLFSCLSVFLSMAFGFSNLSALVGVVTCLSGVFSLLTGPLLDWGLLRGFREPNALILALCAASLAFPWWMAVRGGHTGLLSALHAVK